MKGRPFSPALPLVLCWGLTAAAWVAPPRAPAADEGAPKSNAPAAKPEVAPKPEAAAKADAAPKPDAATTHTVKKGLMKVALDLDGIFEAQASSEILIRPEEWSSTSGLAVVSAIKHGARVKKGDVLLTLDTEKIDKAIDDLRAELKLSDLSLKQADEQLRALEKTSPLDKEALERAARITDEDHKYHLEVERPHELKVTEFNLRSAKNSLEYAEDELRQLEKMYKADDVTEETEEIVLKRQRDQVAYIKMMVESAQLRHDFTLKYSLPRGEERFQEAYQRQQTDYQRARILLPVALEKQRLETERLKVLRGRSDERLKKLLADRDLMTVKAPQEGVVYYGKCTRGKCGDALAAAEMLRPNGSVQPNQVLMTIVQLQSIAIRTTVPEDQLHRVRLGLTGVAVPAAFPELKLSAVVSRLSDVPVGPASFDALVKVTVEKDSKAILPGMACKVKLVPYLKQDAILVPPKSVLNDDVDDSTYVYVVGKDGKHAKRPVTVGNKNDRGIEILKGLAEGEQVLLEAPKDAK